MASELEVELVKLRSNADNLTRCLNALLRRIEEVEGNLESANASQATSPRAQSAADTQGGSEVHQSESVTVDPNTGLKKRTVITERVLTTRTYHSLNTPSVGADKWQTASSSSGVSPRSWRSGENGEAAPHYSARNGDRLATPAHDARTSTILAEDLKRIEVEQVPVGGEFVVTKVAPELMDSIRPGDIILAVNGEPIAHRKQLRLAAGSTVTLTLELSGLYSAPMVGVVLQFTCGQRDFQEFRKALEDYEAGVDGKWTSPQHFPTIAVRKGDILQVMSSDDQYMQARKVDDLQKFGLIPSDLRTDRVSMQTPYGRRVLVLLGAKGVGRRTLKRMLLAQLPDHFTTVVPGKYRLSTKCDALVTSRAPRAGEQEGREYHFETKEQIRERIRQGDMLEWGELDAQLYGTSAQAVRRVIRSGRVCVLDCAPKALKHVYNREFAPYVVALVPPELSEYVQLTKARGETNAKSEPELREICEESTKLVEGEYRRYIDLVLVNRNFDITLRRLMEALDRLKNEPQWIPLEWQS
ncbi:Guanylate kinase family protein [Aphelenchoides avenae]|nr:Guanylate kinase family protein [Aphelenchus avenae]